ncbi:MAG: hypothetical protein ACPHO4_01375, partial [Longimicrobiales bacterium]
MSRSTLIQRLLLTPLAIVLVTATSTPTRVHAQLDLEALQDEAVTWLQEYIRINTINPPGNETAGAEFFA